MLQANVKRMNILKSKEGMDIVIISVQNPDQELFWERRLRETQGQVLKPQALLLVVQEDWPGGAGNGLGTLYAYIKAREKGLKTKGIDIFQKQKEGCSIAIYHTAGEGKRLYPLTASEYNNKSAVKLPSLVTIHDHEEPITILEAVIKQTAIYASSRKKRLSVFWGDQLFIPSASPDYRPKAHVDILAKLGPMPLEDEWKAQGLDKYGLITLNKVGQAIQIEKMDFATIKKLIVTGKVSISGGVGLSLGGFSLSLPMTFALMGEFAQELDHRIKRMDSDTQFWMPMTLDESTYVEIMKRKGEEGEHVKDHYHRMQHFKERFLLKSPELDFLNAVDIGLSSAWWDFGQMDRYYDNLLKMTQNSVEGHLMRSFFGVPQQADSCVLNCQIGKCRSVNSVVMGVQAEELDVENCVLINSCFKNLSSKSSLLYNVFEQEPYVPVDGTIRSDVFEPLEQEQIKLFAKKLGDGKRDWEVRLPNNTYTFAQVSEKLKRVDATLAHEQFQKIKRKKEEG
jgi:hypothetical protein